MENQPVVG